MSRFTSCLGSSLICLLFLSLANCEENASSQDQETYEQVATACSFSSAGPVDKQCILAHRSDLEYLYFHGSISDAEKYDIGRKLMVSYGNSDADLVQFAAVASKLNDFQDAYYGQDSGQSTSETTQSSTTTAQQDSANGTDGQQSASSTSNQVSSNSTDEQDSADSPTYTPTYTPQPSMLSTFMAMLSQDVGAYTQNRALAAQAQAQAAAAQQQAMQAERAAQWQAQYNAAQAQAAQARAQAAQAQAAAAAAQRQAAQAQQRASTESPSTSSANTQPSRPPMQVSVTNSNAGAPYRSVNVCSSAGDAGEMYDWDQDFNVTLWVNQPARIEVTVTLTDGSTITGQTWSAFGGNVTSTMTAGIGCGVFAPPARGIRNVSWDAKPQ